MQEAGLELQAPLVQTAAVAKNCGVSLIALPAFRVRAPAGKARHPRLCSCFFHCAPVLLIQIQTLSVSGLGLHLMWSAALHVKLSASRPASDEPRRSGCT